MLDGVGPQYARCDHSINISIHIFRSVNLSEFFIHQPIPILTLTIVLWITSMGSIVYVAQGEVQEAVWGSDLLQASLAITMTVNALATGLIVFRIFMVFRQSRVTSDDQVFRATRGTKLRTN